MSARIPVAILGATGSVGQRFISLLEDHPWFEVAEVVASERSAGRTYREAVHWVQAKPLPESAAELVVRSTEAPPRSRLVFSALDASVAGAVETACATAGRVVVSNARNHRMDPDVPLLVPEVNPGHLALLDRQGFGGGAIVTNPNCSTIGLTLALCPLHAAFGVGAVNVVSMQAVSGAGLPGVSSLEAVDNVIPHIGGEEEKLESEPLKIFGRLEAGRVVPAPLKVSAQCNRVPVVDGHTLSVSVALGREVSEEEIVDAWVTFRGRPQELGLPSAPEHPLVHVGGTPGPQPRLHRDLGGGMSAAVGRLRPCALLGHRFVTVSHNTVRGAAGGAILCAELLVAEEVVEGLKP